MACRQGPAHDGRGCCQRSQGGWRDAPGDEFGNVHHIICCDFKQLPPATSRPPFIASDPAVLATFDFRALKENRRLAVGTDVSHQRSLDAFHTTLERIARGDAGAAVRRFFVEAYARGAGVTAATVPFEDHTAVTAKRRYRDRWNAEVLKRSGKTHTAAPKISKPCSSHAGLKINTSATRPQHISAGAPDLQHQQRCRSQASGLRIPLCTVSFVPIACGPCL